jgi:hypothetical protein
MAIRDRRTVDGTAQTRPVDRTDAADRDDRREVYVDRNPVARGGVSLPAIVTGTIVAFGAFIVLAAILGGILAATGIADGGITANEIDDIGLGAGIGLVVAQFLAYYWGGYTAGRMARGAGILNGILVPILAIIVVAILGAIVTAIGDSAGVDVTNVQELPLPLGTLGDIGTIVGIALLAVMLLGGALGGAVGQRWHTKLEKREADDRTAV